MGSMFRSRMFRERALQRRARQEPLDDRLQVSAPHEWLIVAGLAVMLLVLAAFAVFGGMEFERQLMQPVSGG